MKKVVSSLRRALIACVFLGGLLALPAVAMVAPAQASVIYDFVCTAPTADCGGDSQFGGYFEFSDAAVAAGSFDGGGGNWVSFVFTSGSSGVTWTLPNLFDQLAEIAFVLTDDRSRILSITDTKLFSSNLSFVLSGEVLTIRDVTCQNITCEVWDDDFITGEWVRRPAALSVPGTLALFGLGLAGVAVLCRRRA